MIMIIMIVYFHMENTRHVDLSVGNPQGGVPTIKLLIGSHANLLI